MASNPPRVLIVGHLTLDRFDDRVVPGGGVSYAARTAAALGERLSILTCGGPDANIDALDGHDLRLVHAEATLTFGFAGVNGQHKLRVLARPQRRLTAADLPPGWERTRLVILAPLLPDDIDLPSFADLPAPDGTAVLAQGLQRHLTQSSAVQSLSHPTSELMDSCSRAVSVFLSEEETSNWPEEDFEALIHRAGRVIVTRGARGADIYAGSARPLHVDAHDVADVDATGAGDAFATAFMLTLHEGDEAAARVASAYAAAAVERSGPAPLPPLSRLLSRPAASARVSSQ